jgi:hypothetical protein
MKKTIFVLTVLIYMLSGIESSGICYAQFKYLYGRTDSVGYSAPDTLTRLDTNTGSRKYDYLSDKGQYFWFSIVTDSALQFSTNINFPAGLTWDIPAGTSFTSPSLSSAIGNGYLRKKNNFSGNANYTISIGRF